jgi:pyridinium-3,5-biscarboxylic acid mononucleotide synthase
MAGTTTMDEQSLRQLLEEVQGGQTSVSEALSALAAPALPFANLDHGRARRTGVPEVVFCQGKTVAQVVQIVGQILKHEGRVLATRASPEIARAVLDQFPGARYDELARVITLYDTEPVVQIAGRTERVPGQPYIVVATGGTSDIPVAEESALTLEFLGDHVLRTYDVGVAGIHRLLSRQELLRGAAVIIAVAGMEGALASVVAGLVDCPVVAVPTSIGYGASFGGLAALLSMLNACAPGVSVVNIDNGFGAAVVAHQIVKVRDGEHA